jgi:hypothetical protein
MDYYKRVCLATQSFGCFQGAVVSGGLYWLSLLISVLMLWKWVVLPPIVKVLAGSWIFICPTHFSDEDNVRGLNCVTVTCTFKCLDCHGSMNCY